MSGKKKKKGIKSAINEPLLVFGLILVQTQPKLITG